MKIQDCFDAALFDLDGTLLDSIGVWADVDRIFFARRGMDVPEDYARAIAGMSFIGTAEYTRARFSLPEEPARIAREWTDIVRHEYAERVPLKKGAAELLGALRDRGVRLCVVTTLLPELFEPCLRRHGILDMFEFCLTTDQTGGAGKGDGHIYAAAARKLGVPFDRCAVFEDVPEGIEGAKRQGMRAYCVVDPASTHSAGRVKALADGWAEDPAGFL